MREALMNPLFLTDRNTGRADPRPCAESQNCFDSRDEGRRDGQHIHHPIDQHIEWRKNQVFQFSPTVINDQCCGHLHEPCQHLKIHKDKGQRQHMEDSIVVSQDKRMEHRS